MLDQIQTSRRRIKLSGDASYTRDAYAAHVMSPVLERVVQQTFYSLVHARERMEMRSLESLIFLCHLHDAAQESLEENGQAPSEVSLFAKPLALYEFLLQDRRYTTRSRRDRIERHGAVQPSQAELTGLLTRLRRTTLSDTEPLSPVPRSDELLRILLAEVLQQETEVAAGPGSEADDAPWESREVHAARRNAISSWQHRACHEVHRQYHHQSGTGDYFPFPFVDGLVLDGAYLALFVASPLNPHFLDEKIPEDHRVCEISLAIYDVRNVRHTGKLSVVMPAIRDAFGRVVFTDMTYQNGAALQAMFGEMGAISRHWVRVASEGLNGLFDDNEVKSVFDAFKFCEAVVHKTLCAEIPDAHGAETYPFDRAIVFSHAGTLGRPVADPIEMYVLEASIRSKDSADQGTYLTRWQRELRKTQDYECEASQKIIAPENSFRFFVHGTDRGLVLSRQSVLNPEAPSMMGESGRSNRSTQADKASYPVGAPSPNDNSLVSTAVYNLLGRLFAEARVEKDDEEVGGIQFQSKVFRPDFERRRLEIKQRFGTTGLYFHYEHGIDLKSEAPILFELQRAYFRYLDDKFETQKVQFQEEEVREKCADPEQVGKILREIKLKKSETDSLGDPTQQQSINSAHAAKVVYISFCSDLHVENRQAEISRDRHRRGQRLMGPEYTYTIILISDQDREKSGAQLKAEREDLRLFFEQLMQQIWMSKHHEHEYLAKKRRSIGASLESFLHRVKGLMPDKKKRDEVEDFWRSIEALLDPGQSPVRLFEVDGSENLLEGLLTGLMTSSDSADEPVAEKLQQLASRWFPQATESIPVRLVPSYIPAMTVRWADAVVRDAFYTVLKNACEAAVAAAAEVPPEVRVQVIATPREGHHQGDAWWLGLEVVNTGGPIPAERLRKLVDDEPQPVNPESKEGSTGVGIFVARSLLQDVIGDGADLFFANVGNGRVQVRLRLPAQLTATLDDASETAPPMATPDRKYVLYVEDDPLHYQENLGPLQSLLAQHGVDLIHTRTLEAARRHYQERLPELLISDLYIFGSDTQEIADKKYGSRLISGFMRFAGPREHQPPVWVLTSEGEQSLRKQVGDISALGYRFEMSTGERIERDEVGRFTASGTLCVFPDVKRLGEIDRFDRLIEAVLAQTSAADEPQATGIAAGTAATELTADSQAIDMQDDAWREELARQTSTGAWSADRYVIVWAQADSLGQIVNCLDQWFSHAGLSDPDPPVDPDDPLYRLGDHVNLKRLLLGLELPQEFYAQLRPEWLYWGLSHNLFFTHRALNLAHVARTWKLMRNEDRGPLSVLRHDLLGMLKAAGRTDLRSKVLSPIQQCEERLGVDVLADSFANLEAAATAGRLATHHLESLLLKPEQVSQVRGQISSDFQKLEQVLQEIGGSMEEFQEELTHQRMWIETVDHYLGGDV